MTYLETSSGIGFNLDQLMVTFMIILMTFVRIMIIITTPTTMMIYESGDDDIMMKSTLDYSVVTTHAEAVFA